MAGVEKGPRDGESMVRRAAACHQAIALECAAQPRRSDAQSEAQAARYVHMQLIAYSTG